MKHLILFTLFVLCSSISFSQISFPKEFLNETDPVTGWNFRFKDYEIDSIKRAFFVYKKQDESLLSEMKELLSDSWKHSDLVFISNDESKVFEFQKHDVIFKLSYTFRQDHLLATYDR